MELRLEGTIDEERNLQVTIPSDAPTGKVEVTLRPKETIDFEKRNRELLAWLETLHADPNRKTRTREEIDAQIQAERDAWD